MRGSPAGAAEFNLGMERFRAHDWRGAALSFRRAARADHAGPGSYAATQNVVAAIAQAVNSGSAPLFASARPSIAAGTQPVSIVVCSIDDGRLATMQASFRSALGARAHEFIVIRDARSLCEGYGRGLRQSRHPIVVFAHDDVELLSPQPFEALDAALEAYDVAGVVGATAVTGPAVGWAGHPHLHGWLAYPADGGACTASVFSLRSGLIGGMHALDGLLFAARRDAALAIGFDETTFDGFHFYDLDFTYRAHRAGLRAAVTTRIVALHASLGSYDERWRVYAERFMRKFALPPAPQGAHHAYAARLASREHTVRFFAELEALCALPE